MGRAHRRSTHHARMPVACPAPAEGGARHPRRPSRDGTPDALGAPAGLSTPRVSCRRTPHSRRDAEVAAQDLLTPALLNHSRRAYAWGAALAALHEITFDRELLYLAAMYHDTGLPPVPHVDFTVRSAALARDFTNSHGVPADGRTRRQRDRHALQPRREHRIRRRGLSCCLQARRSTCSGYAVTRYPTRSGRAWSRSTPGWDSSGSSPALPSRGQASSSWSRVVPAPVRHERLDFGSLLSAVDDTRTLKRRWSAGIAHHASRRGARLPKHGGRRPCPDTRRMDACSVREPPREPQTGLMARQAGWSGLFSTAFKQSRNAMVLVDERRIQIDVNGAYLKLLGYDRRVSSASPSTDSLPARPGRQVRNGRRRWPSANSLAKAT